MDTIEHCKVSISRVSQATQGNVTPVLKVPDSTLCCELEVWDMPWLSPRCSTKERHSATQAITWTYYRHGSGVFNRGSRSDSFSRCDAEGTCNLNAVFPAYWSPFRTNHLTLH